MAITPSSTAVYIDKITLPSGTEYEIVDTVARQTIDNMSKYTSFLGVTSSDINDGTTNAVVVINSNSVTATEGSIVIKTTNSTTAGRIAQEFIYANGAWQLFGDISAQNLGNLAYKSTATAIYRPAGTISITTSTLTSNGKFTPSGGVSLTTTNAVAKLSTTSTAPTGSATANFWIYKPGGEITVTTTPSRTLTTATVLSAITGKTVMSSITSGAPTATAPTGGLNYTAITNHNLKLQYIIQNTTNAISSTSTKSVVTGVTVSGTATATFEGTEIYLKHPTIEVPITATFTGTQGTITVTGTVISGATFSGTTATIQAT